jgi:hypothetical protein
MPVKFQPLITRGQGFLALPVQQKWFSNNRLKCAVCFHPCPRGYAGDAEKTCTCSANVVAREQKHISGPLLDCIDIHVEVPRYQKWIHGTRIAFCLVTWKPD